MWHSDLHAALNPPAAGARLAETHGERLEFFVSWAPGRAWAEWLYASLGVAALADIEVFLRLFALCRNDSKF